MFECLFDVKREYRFFLVKVVGVFGGKINGQVRIYDRFVLVFVYMVCKVYYVGILFMV